MAIPKPKKIDIADRPTRQVTESIINTVNQIVDKPIIDGVLIEDVALTNSNKDVIHGLGRKPRGFIVVKRNANAQVWEPAQSYKPDTVITLRASANVTASIWVF